MSINPRCFGLSQVTNLVANITKKNLKGNSNELSVLLEKHGPEAEKHLFRCLINSLDFSQVDGKGAANVKEVQQIHLLMDEAAKIISRPNFVSVLCYGFEKLENKSLRPVSQILPIVSKAIRLTKVQEVVFALALANSTENELRQHAAHHLRIKLSDLVRSYSDLSSGFEGGLSDVAIEVLHLLLSYLLQHTEDEIGIPQDTLEVFINILRRDFPRDRVPVVLAPLLYKDEQDITEERLVPVSVSLPSSAASLELAEIIHDVGYAASSSKHDMLEILKDYGKANITPAVIARVLGMMTQTSYSNALVDGIPYVSTTGESSRTVTKSVTSWDSRVLAGSLQILVPNLCWRDVVPEMDYEGFHLSSPDGLSIIMTAYSTGSKDPFPIDMIYGPWVHTSGQLSWFQQALVGCPDFSFSSFPFNSVNLEPLKNSYLNEEAKTWRSLNLIETLLNLAEQGHYSEVISLFRVPMKQCPDVFFLGLLQCKTSWQILQMEMLSHLIPMFFSNHPSSSNILNFVWHSQLASQNVQCMLIQAMSDWYIQGETPDHNRLMRILDVAQDLKMLPVMLKGSQFPFVIDLACWASKRKFLKLDIWMVEKIKEHQEPFVNECIQFLVTRAPKPLHHGTPDNTALSQDTVATMLGCIQPFISSLKTEYAQKLKMLINFHGPVLPSPRPHPLGLPPPPPQPPMEYGVGCIGSPISGNGAFSSNLNPPGSPGKSSIGSMSGFPSSGQSMFSESPFGKLGSQQPVMLQQQQQQQLPQTPVRGDSGDPMMFPPLDQPSKEVDEKANAYFQAIYNGRMAVDHLLEVLKQFKDSQIKKEKDLFVCMLKNIFEEYKFFPQFPEKELRITGQLFGGIIEHGLVTLLSRNLALKFIYDALKKPPTGKMHLFGLAALEKCRKRLKEFPQFCASVAVIPHFASFPAHLKEFIQYGQQSMDPPPSSSSIGLPSFGPPGSELVSSVLIEPPPSSSKSSLPSFHHAGPTALGSSNDVILSPGSSIRSDHSPTTKVPPIQSNRPIGSPSGPKKDQPLSINITNLDTLLGAADHSTEKKHPSEDLQDKLHFLFNNLSSSTLQQKVDEFKDVFEEEYYDWFAQYLVMKRASIEANFHSLYLSFMDMLTSSRLNKAVLRETYRNIKVILQSDKTSDNFSDRAILKNLGKWLGMQTVAKNRPILHIDMSVKDLLLEGYYRGGQDLLYVVPFVAKVLEACADSRIFKPPNPWVMAIMSVLAELHAVPDLKLNLKFEIEVLCKHLSLEISELKKSNILKDVERAKTLFELVGHREKTGPPSVSPPQALYIYEDIPSSLAGIGALIRIDPQISLLQQYPHLKTYIKNAIEKSIQDLLIPVAERSAKIALTTAENIIKKDFSLDPEVVRMHTAAVHMVRNLTAGMAMITCREPLLLSITSNLRSAFSSVLRVRDMSELPASDDQLKQMIEHAAHHLSADNTELACAFIQKTAVEKVVPEMEKRLAEEFELRHNARTERRQYYNSTDLQYQLEKMPEHLRINVGGPNAQQAIVYEEFSRCLPGFLPSQKHALYTRSDSVPQFAPTEEFLIMMNNCAKEITNQIRSVLADLAPPNNPHVALMRSLLDITGVLRANHDYNSVIGLLEKALEGLLEGMNPPPSDPDMFVSFRDCHILILKALQDQRALGANAACRLVTKMLMETREDIKYSPRALILLIGLQLVDMKQLDEFLAKAVESGRNLVALSCSIKLVTAIVSAEKRDTPITDCDLKKTKETLFRLSANLRQLPESTAQLLEPFCREHDIRVSVLGPDIDGRPSGLHSNAVHPATTPTVSSGGELEDPPGLYEKVEYLLSEWVRHFHQPGLMRDGDKVYAAYVARLQQQGILKNDDLIQRFFRISMEMCVELCYRTLNDPVRLQSNVHGMMSAGMSRPKCYHTMDAFVKLVVVLVRYSGEPTNTLAKVNLLNKVLMTVTQVLIHDHDKRQLDFHQLPYHRFFIMLLNDLCTPDPVFDAINFPVLQCFSAAYHMVRPSKAPGFSYAWLELISHRVFIAKLLLQTTQQKGWPLFHQLLIDLFRFLSPFLRNAELVKATQTLYKGTLRVLLVLLHDFPEFLCDYHFSFCDVIPPNCIQMRNLILSAFPRNMRLPDPFTPNLKVELLPDIQNAPRVLPSYVQIISPTLKKELDNYIKTRAPVTFLQDLRGHLQVSSEPGKQYNVSLINALVLFVGTQAITYIHSKSGTPSTSAIAHTAHMDIFQHLVVDLDTEGRYLFLNAIANQLRYPNSHTHFFSCALLSLFAETNHEAIQEQITRVLLERLIVNRPHPWGLLITFIDLIKNPTYNFWKHEFVHCAPEIEKLFESVAKSCMQKQPSNNNNNTSSSVRESDSKE